MSATKNDVIVLGWVIPRPTGRWHQSIIVTSRYVWVTPEISFAKNQLLLEAASQGLEHFHTFLRGVNYRSQLERCDIAEVRGVSWNEMTGAMRIAGAGDTVIGAMIPNRDTGTALKPKIKDAIAQRRSKRPDLT